MRKKLLSIVLAAVMLLQLTGCSAKQRYDEHLDDYVFALEYHDDYNILQLTDIHWNVNSSVKSSTAYLDKLFEEVNDHIKKSQGATAVKILV